MRVIDFQEWQTTEQPVTLYLSDEGVNNLRWILERYSNYYQGNEDLYTDAEDFYFLLPDNIDFNDDGTLFLELGQYKTLTGNPHGYTLDFYDDFIATVND